MYSLHELSGGKLRAIWLTDNTSASPNAGSDYASGNVTEKTV